LVVGHAVAPNRDANDGFFDHSPHPAYKPTTGEVTPSALSFTTSQTADSHQESALFSSSFNPMHHPVSFLHHDTACQKQKTHHRPCHRSFAPVLHSIIESTTADLANTLWFLPKTVKEVLDLPLQASSVLFFVAHIQSYESTSTSSTVGYRVTRTP
jgi:hypothetical protein